MPYDSEVIQVIAVLRHNVLGWPAIPLEVQHRIAHFLILDRARLRDRIMVELGREIAPPDNCLFPADPPT